MQFFPVQENSSVKYFFEKSATYFDGELVPKRAHALLPDAKIIVILISPSKRAYSWYHHMRHHNDFAANHYDFYQVITANESSSKELKRLRNRCLFPGKYATYLEKWLAVYPLQQVIILNGDDLKKNPVDTLNDLQKALKIYPFIDYRSRLRYNFFESGSRIIFHNYNLKVCFEKRILLPCHH